MSDTLQQVRDLLADPKHWTKETHARDEYRSYVEPNDPRAVCFCLAGAVCKVLDITSQDANNNPEFKLVGTRLSTAASTIFPLRVADLDLVYVDFNDDPDTTHGDVLVVLDKAIADATPG